MIARGVLLLVYAGYWPWSPHAAERLTHQTASLP
jgi:hypothetical protein